MTILSRSYSCVYKELKLNSEQLFNSTVLSHIIFGVILPPKQRGKISTNSQITPANLDENQNPKVHTIKILLDSGASASNVRKDELYKRH